MGLAGHAGHLVPGVGDRFQPAVLGVRAAGLKGHDEGLAGAVHDRMGHQEALLVDALENFQADADAGIDGGARPGGARFLRGGDQLRRIAFRIGDAEFQAKGRDLPPNAPAVGRLVQLERLAEQGLEGRFAVRLGGFAVDLAGGRFGKSAPEAARAARRHRLFQARAMLVEEIGHVACGPYPCSFFCSPRCRLTVTISCLYIR